MHACYKTCYKNCMWFNSVHVWQNNYRETSGVHHHVCQQWCCSSTGIQVSRLTCGFCIDLLYIEVGWILHDHKHLMRRVFNLQGCFQTNTHPVLHVRLLFQTTSFEKNLLPILWLSVTCSINPSPKANEISSSAISLVTVLPPFVRVRSQRI